VNPPHDGSPPWHVFYFRSYGLPLVAQRLQADGFVLDRIASDTPPAAAEAVLARARVYQVSSGVNDMPAEYLVHDALLDRTPNLLAVCAIGAGYDTVDVAACTRRGVIAFHQAGGANAQAVVEHTLAMMLALGKRLVQADRELHRTPNLERNRFVGNNLHGKTVGILGFGHVGRRLARLCSLGFDARVLVHSRHASQEALRDAKAECLPLDEVLAQSDYVAVCCALSSETRGLMGAAQFARMKRGAYFVTAARGGIHDERALFNALNDGHLAGAGVDVWDVEPPQPDHPLLALAQVIGTPHIGGATVESRQEAAESAANQIMDARRGVRPANLLNPQAWPHYLERLAAAGRD
jgi:D-3-phosphoglycerate dehydrogenase / 2-oxoglutarate reductase